MADIFGSVPQGLPFTEFVMLGCKLGLRCLFLRKLRSSGVVAYPVQPTSLARSVDVRDVGAGLGAKVQAWRL